MFWNSEERKKRFYNTTSQFRWTQAIKYRLSSQILNTSELGMLQSHSPVNSLMLNEKQYQGQVLFHSSWLCAASTAETYTKKSHKKCIIIKKLLVLIWFVFAVIYKVMNFSSSQGNKNIFDPFCYSEKPCRRSSCGVFAFLISISMHMLKKKKSFAGQYFHCWW